MDDTALEDGLDDPVTQLDVYPLKGLIVTSTKDSLKTPNADVPLPDDPYTKTCGGCKITKRHEDFHKDRRAKDGLQWRCRTCTARIDRKPYADAQAKRKRHRNLTRPGVVVLETSRSRDRKAGREPIQAHPEALNAYILNHSGRCDVCDQTCPTERRLCVDHCHETGLVRGMVCQDCNVAAGRLRDDWRRAVSMARYLKAFEEALRPAFANPPTLQIGAMP
jgi:hypothetical protein